MSLSLLNIHYISFCKSITLLVPPFKSYSVTRSSKHSEKYLLYKQAKGYCRVLWDALWYFKILCKCYSMSLCHTTKCFIVCYKQYVAVYGGLCSLKLASETNLEILPLLVNHKKY